MIIFTLIYTHKSQNKKFDYLVENNEIVNSLDE